MRAFHRSEILFATVIAALAMMFVCPAMAQEREVQPADELDYPVLLVHGLGEGPGEEAFGNLEELLETYYFDVEVMDFNSYANNDLADHRDAIPTLAKWYHQEWSHFRPGWTVEDFAASIAERANADRVPLTLVAFEGEDLVGTICLDMHDMETRGHLSPWLGGLYVKEEWRRRGIGTELVRAIEAKAAELGIRRLYLYTPESEHFYAKLGWCLIETTVYHGCEVAIMEKALLAAQEE